MAKKNTADEEPSAKKKAPAKKAATTATAKKDQKTAPKTKAKAEGTATKETKEKTGKAEKPKKEAPKKATAAKPEPKQKPQRAVSPPPEPEPKKPVEKKDPRHVEPQRNPANAVFALMEDREFRYSVIRPAIEKDKAGICRLATGKHQVKGFRNIALAPTVMLLPVLSQEANASTELAQRLLQSWLDDHADLRALVSAKLKALNYQPSETPITQDGFVEWRSMEHEHATTQYDGSFIDAQDKNAVMLMSLLLGWFGSDQDYDDEA